MEIIKELYKLIEERKESKEEGSYTKYLLDKGTDKILKKFGEEAIEVVIAAKGEEKEHQVSEICDVLYHMLVLMVDKDIKLEAIEEELTKRNNKMNNFKGERKAVEKL